jgi:tetratricopeptide (TPR) repeat protein
VEKGNRDFELKQLADAKNEYQQAIQIDPDLAEAHYRMGLLEVRQEHPTAATSSFQRAIELDSKNLDARLQLGSLGQIALQQMQYVPAENELQQAISLAPRDAQAYEDLGLAQLLDAENGAAEKSFQDAVNVQPDDPQTYINLSNFYSGQNNAARAEQVLQQGIARNPKAVELPIGLAGFYSQQGRLPDAKRILDRVETDAGGYADGRRAVAEFYLANGDAAAALQRFRALADQDSRDQESAKKVAGCYLQLGQWQEANDWIDRHDAKDVDLRLLRARSDLGAFRLRQAAAELQKLLQDSPEVPAVYYYLGQVHIQRSWRWEISVCSAAMRTWH